MGPPGRLAPCLVVMRCPRSICSAQGWPPLCRPSPSPREQREDPWSWSGDSRCSAGSPALTGQPLDLDTVSRLEEGQTGQLELLVAAGATLSGPSGVQLPTALGQVQIDVLQVADADFDPLPDDPTDRLHVLSHAWAADTATLMTLMADAPPPVDVLVAQPAALVAMKLQSAMNRGAAKEGTDFLDIVRLSTDPVTNRPVVDGLQSAGQQFKDDALLHVGRWFEKGRDRTLKRIRTIPEGGATTMDDLDLVAELLTAALGR